MENNRDSRITLIVFVALLMIISIGALLVLASRPEPTTIILNPPPPTGTPQPTATPAPITVYVTGAINNAEQLITVPYNSRVQDVIDAAGGLRDDADIVRINLAAIVRDGDQIHVSSLVPIATATGIANNNARPTATEIISVSTATIPAITATTQAITATIQPDDATPQGNTDTDFTTDETDNLIDLNQATQADLETLPGIGPALATRIIAYRDEIGQFTSLSELDNVSGIGQATLEELQPFLTIDSNTRNNPLPEGMVRATIPPLATASGHGTMIILNRATQAELETLPGIGPALAERIITYRDDIGGFTSIEDLDDVSGIGEATLERLRPLLVLD